MSNRNSFYFPRVPGTFGHTTAEDAIVKDGLTDVYDKVAMGVCGEKTAVDQNITREEQDEYAVNSYKRAAAAWASKAFEAEIAPVTIADKRKGDTVIFEDEEYKKVKLEKLPSLKPVFKKDGTITAANASTLNDGASALVLASQAKVDELGLKPLARIVCELFTLCEMDGWLILPNCSLRRRRLRSC